MLLSEVCIITIRTCVSKEEKRTLKYNERNPLCKAENRLWNLTTMLLMFRTARMWLVSGAHEQ